MDDPTSRHVMRIVAGLRIAILISMCISVTAIVILTIIGVRA